MMNRNLGPAGAVEQAARRWRALAGRAAGPQPLQPFQPSRGGMPFADALLKGRPADPFRGRPQGGNTSFLDVFTRGFAPLADAFARGVSPFGRQGFSNRLNPFVGRVAPEQPRPAAPPPSGAPVPAPTAPMAAGGGGVPRWSGEINRVSQETGVPWQVLASIMSIETGGANVTNSVGATGLMQVMPQYWQSTANKYGGDLSNPYTNIRTAADILLQNYRQYGSWENAAAAYFGGGGAFNADGSYSSAFDAYGTDIGTYVGRFRNYMSQYGYGSPSSSGTMAGG